MLTKTLQLLAVLCIALAMAAGWAHLLEMPAKMSLAREQYFTVQQIYRGWALLGVVIFAALAASTVLAVREWGSGPPAYLATLAAVCIALSLVVFFAFTFPVNKVTKNWTVLPETWQALRMRWEYSHAANATLYLFALVSMVLSIIWARR